MNQPMPVPPDPIALRDIIITMTAEVTERPIAVNDESGRRTFDLLGVDSVSVFQLQMKIETHWELMLPDDFLLRHPSPDQAASAILSRLHS